MIQFKAIKKNKTLINGTMFSMFSFINRGISFVLLIILARYIMPAEYGRLSLFNTIVSLLGFIIALSCQGYFTISYFQRKGELFRQDVSSIVLILAVCTVVLSTILIFFQETLARLAELPSSFLWFALIICIGEIFFYLLMDLMRIQEKVTRYGILSCGFALISFIISIYLVVYKGLNWEGRIYTHLIIAVVSGSLGLFVLYRKRLFSPHFTWKGTKTILKWGIPLIPHCATGWIKNGCDRFIINGTHTIADVGVFSFALNMVSIINMIGIAFNSTHSITLYQILSSESPVKQKKILLKKQTRLMGIIYTIGFFFVLIVGTLLIYIALPQYSASVPYFWITSISGYMNCLYYLFSTFIFYYHKNQVIMFITFLTACLHLVLSIIFTRYSLYYTAWIYVFTQAIVLVLTARQSIKVLCEKMVD